MAHSGRFGRGDGWLAASDDGREGLRGAGGEAGIDGDLVVFLVVDQFQAEGGEQAGLDAGEQVGQGVAEDRQRVQQARVVALAGGAVQGGQPLVDLDAFGFQFGEPGGDPGPQCGDRREPCGRAGRFSISRA